MLRMRFLLALSFVAAASPALAESCSYWNIVNSDTVSISNDAQELAHVVFGGAIITCHMIDNRFARGPFPYQCTNGETSWELSAGMFPDADGKPAALLMYDNLIWYRRCT